MEQGLNKGRRRAQGQREQRGLRLGAPKRPGRSSGVPSKIFIRHRKGGIAHQRLDRQKSPVSPSRSSSPHPRPTESRPPSALESPLDLSGSSPTSAPLPTAAASAARADTASSPGTQPEKRDPRPEADTSPRRGPAPSNDGSAPPRPLVSAGGHAPKATGKRRPTSPGPAPRVPHAPHAESQAGTISGLQVAFILFSGGRGGAGPGSARVIAAPGLPLPRATVTLPAAPGPRIRLLGGPQTSERTGPWRQRSPSPWTAYAWSPGG
ncbi:translation initiation factor IF-2 [Dromiciops gliroides]|uniref:translation initiation factor IF-2 n=1 Tax=Dromiciops gliroides TaxID=33562 RepID=UPI001CC79DE6|nr:translation initiation factor IF-2 [Dromiciops gliroides]